MLTRKAMKEADDEWKTCFRKIENKIKINTADWVFEACLLNQFLIFIERKYQNTITRTDINVRWIF